MKKIMQKVLLSVFVLGGFFSLSANEMYVFQDAKVKIDNERGKLYIGTPVKVLKNIDDKNVLVELRGVAFANKLYTSKNKALLMAMKKEGNFAKNNQVSTIQAVIEKAYLSKVPSEIWEEHEEFYYDMCSQCHTAHQAKTHTMIEWEAVLQSMKGFAQLYDDEAEYLLRFLKANANNGFYPEKK